MSKPFVQSTTEREVLLLKAADEWRQVESGHSSQGLLWVIVRAAMCSEHAEDWKPRDIDNVLFLYERMHNLIHDIDPDRSDPKYRYMSQLDLE